MTQDPTRAAVEQVFGEDVLAQALRLRISPAEGQSPAQWMQSVRKAALLAALRAPKPLGDVREDQWLRDRVSNLTIGLEEIRDASWPGEDAVERIRGCASRWLDGSEEHLDAHIRSSFAVPAVPDREGIIEECAAVAEEIDCDTCGTYFHPSKGHYDDDCAGGRSSWGGQRDASSTAAAIRALKPGSQS